MAIKKTLLRVEEEVRKVISGKDEIIHQMLTSILAGGHILLEDVPGVGKTTMAVAFSKAMDLEYRRMQFTPDVMPSDVLGYCMYDREQRANVYVPGGIICNLFLADEINRTSSKTQSALLEAMEEGQITVDAYTRALPDPFLVIATENPIGAAGTQMLPDSQLDRFMIRLSVGYPEESSEIAMMKARHKTNPMENVQCVMTKEELLEGRSKAEEIFVHDKIYEYVTALVNRTRKHPLLSLGVSPRGSLSLISMAKAHALMAGRDYVLAEDVEDIFVCTVAHRILLTPMARAQKNSTGEIAAAILKEVAAPSLSAKDF